MIDLVTLIGTSLPRVVSRWLPDVTFRVPTSRRVVYLTFDDGPNPDLTESIVETLERFDARASFFVLGSNAKRHPSLVRLLVDGGHTVGNHTFSHADAWRADAADVVRELEDGTRAIEDAAGQGLEWMRPPYGHFTRGMRDWCHLRGQTMTMWDLGTGDFLERVSAAHVTRHVDAYVRPGSVIVLHDNPCCRDTTPDALRRILERLSADGWSFEALPTADPEPST